MPAYSPLTNVQPTGLARELAARADASRPIRIGVIGSGEMGTDLVTQGALMRGIEIAFPHLTVYPPQAKDGSAPALRVVTQSG